MPFTQTPQIDRRGPQRLLPREGQHALRQLGAALRCSQDRLQSRVAALRVVRQQFRIPQDDRKQVVEVVRDPAGQLAHRFHFLGLVKPLLAFVEFLRPLGDALFQFVVRTL